MFIQNLIPNYSEIVCNREGYTISLLEATNGTFQSPCFQCICKVSFWELSFTSNISTKAHKHVFLTSKHQYKL